MEREEKGDCCDTENFYYPFCYMSHGPKVVRKVWSEWVCEDRAVVLGIEISSFPRFQQVSCNAHIQISKKKCCRFFSPFRKLIPSKFNYLGGLSPSPREESSSPFLKIWNFPFYLRFLRSDSTTVIWNESGRDHGRLFWWTCGCWWNVRQSFTLTAFFRFSSDVQIRRNNNFVKRLPINGWEESGELIGIEIEIDARNETRRDEEDWTEQTNYGCSCNGMIHTVD